MTQSHHKPDSSFGLLPNRDDAIDVERSCVSVLVYLFDQASSNIISFPSSKLIKNVVADFLRGYHERIHQLRKSLLGVRATIHDYIRHASFPKNLMELNNPAISLSHKPQCRIDSLKRKMNLLATNKIRSRFCVSQCRSVISQLIELFVGLPGSRRDPDNVPRSEVPFTPLDISSRFYMYSNDEPSRRVSL